MYDSPAPSGWAQRRLLDVVDLPSGQVDPKQEPYRSQVLVAPDHVEGRTGRLLAKSTAAEQRAISGKYPFEPGDVIYSKIRPYLRKAVLADFEGLCSADMYPLRPKEGIEPRFLLALILGEDFSRFAEIVSMRSGFPKINRSELGEYVASLPRPEEQRRIAEILDTVDEAIRSTEAVIKKLEQVKRGLLHDLLTRGIDDNGELRDPERHPEQFKDSPLGRIPREWEVRPLGELVDSAIDGPFGSNLKSSHYVDAGVRVVRLQNVGNGHFDDSDKAFISPGHARTLARHDVVNGDLLVASLGDENHPIARACLYPESLEPGIVKADCFRLRPDKRNDAGFLMMALNCPATRVDINGLAQGVTRDRVNLGNLKTVRLPVPSRDEQVRCYEAFRRVVRKAEEERERATKLRLTQDRPHGRPPHRARPRLYRGDSRMSFGPEYEKVELPFIDQLSSMPDDQGQKLWKYTTGNLDEPSVTGRSSFREVLIREDLEAAVRRINLGPDGTPWLDDARVSTAFSAMERVGSSKLMEANQAAHRLLLQGTPVEGLPGWDGGRTQTIHFIDWKHPERNTFRVVNQFRVNEPGGQAHGFILPDIVLFVNGIPLVVIECKSPTVSEPIAAAIDQLQRYSNQRHWFDDNEGNEKLFHYNAVTVATSFDEARVGTISASSVHYLEWKDTSPWPTDQVCAVMGKEHLSSQEKLVAGLFRPAHLLDLVRHFIVFDPEGGKVIKKAARYQQFRAVNKAVHRLRTGKTKAEDGEHDRRGGIIWHTQGSGKSLSMVFLVKRMRSDPDLRKFKVVVVTDRRDLQDQLSTTAELTGETVKIAKSIGQLKNLLAQKGPGLVFAMIQKYREPDATNGDDEELDEDAIPDERSTEPFPVLNDDESILVMVDEAHRTHGSTLHANLLTALPNCARIGFTGTPIIMGAKKRTHEIFGDFIDKYTIKQAEDDGSTLPILYEGRTTEGAVRDGRDLDDLFEDMFVERTPEELEAIKKKYATKGHVMEATKLIRAKAKDMLRHYVENILPNGFKAQVVAVSRKAAARYYEAFLEARDDLVERLENLPDKYVGMSDAEIEGLPTRRQYHVRARRHLDRIRDLEFAPVFSSAHNDPPEWSEWTDKGKVKQRIADFKKPFDHEDPEKRSNLAFLIVKSMLITGFDAPIAQAQYLDRHIREAELLQAIARVNRTRKGKTAGIVVDYYGVAQHLKEALAAYTDEDVDGALRSMKDELPKLRDRHFRVIHLFEERDVDIYDEDEAIELLRDEKLRAEFAVKLKQFLATLDLVLPRPEGLPYVKDARQLGTISLRARNRYRDDALRPVGKDVGKKVGKLIDDHVISLGIDPKIPPVSILDAEFDEQVEAKRSPRAKASEMEHALRYHIRKHLDEDPELYEKLSERLDGILTELKERWDELVEALQELVQDAREGRATQDTAGLDPETQAPFLGVLKQEVAGKEAMEPEDLRELAVVTVELVDHIQQTINTVGFWKNQHRQNQLRKWIVGFLDDREVLPFDKLPAVADRLVDLARANRHRFER